MKIAAIGIEDKTSASRRIRYKTFLSNLPGGYVWHKWERGGGFDLLYIQKLLRSWTISAAAKAYARGIPVVFDVDDIREEWNDKPYDEMFRYVAAITTDTEDRAAELRKHTQRPVFVVPDTIDYNAVTADPLEIRPGIKSIVTFGRWQNVAAAEPYFNALLGRYDLRYICDRKIACIAPYAKFVEWNAKTFLEDLHKSDVAIIAHHPHWAVNMKSNNRLLVCMATGMPAIMSPSKAYDNTLRNADMNGLLCGLCEQFNIKSLRETMARLEPAQTREMMAWRFIEYAKKNYHPSLAGQQLAEVFRACMSMSEHQ